MSRKLICANPVPMETATGIQSFLMGVLLVVSHDAGWSQSFLNDIAPGVTWGIALIVLGASQIAAIHSLPNGWRTVIAILTLFLYIFIDVSLWLSRSAPLSAITLLGFVILAAWSAAIYSTRNRVNCGN